MPAVLKKKKERKEEKEKSLESNKTNRDTLYNASKQKGELKMLSSISVLCDPATEQIAFYQKESMRNLKYVHTGPPFQCKSAVMSVLPR